MAKKSALGKGLGAFFGEEQKSAITSQALKQLAIEEIRSNPLQPRKSFDEARLKELSDSIKEHGVVQPVVCTREADGYRLVVGERRWRAAQMAGLTHLPAIIKEMQPKEVLQVALIENIQRQDLNPIEESKALSYLLSEHGLTQQQLAQQLGKSRSSIANSLRLLKLDKIFQDKLEAGIFSEGHARCLLSLENPKERSALAKEIEAQALSVRQCEQWVQTRKKPSESSKKKSVPPKLGADWLAIEKHLTQQLGTEVEISKDKKGKGKITLNYQSQEQLEKLVEMLIYLGERVKDHSSLELL